MQASRLMTEHGVGSAFSSVPVQLGAEMPPWLAWACLACLVWLLCVSDTPPGSTSHRHCQRLSWDWREGARRLSPSAPSLTGARTGRPDGASWRVLGDHRTSGDRGRTAGPGQRAAWVQEPREGHRSRGGAESDHDSPMLVLWPEAEVRVRHRCPVHKDWGGGGRFALGSFYSLRPPPFCHNFKCAEKLQE